MKLNYQLLILLSIVLGYATAEKVKCEDFVRYLKEKQKSQSFNDVCKDKISELPRLVKGSQAMKLKVYIENILELSSITHSIKEVLLKLLTTIKNGNEKTNESEFESVIKCYLFDNLVFRDQFSKAMPFSRLTNDDQCNQIVEIARLLSDLPPFASSAY